MTKQELDKLKRLANAALPGPWVVVRGSSGRVVWIENKAGCEVVDTADTGIVCRHEDANFIAAAREAVPRLIARVRELEDLLDEPPCDHCNNCDEGCWGPRRESMQDRGSRALRGRIA